MTLLAGIVVVACGLALIAFTGVVFARPALAERFLMSFASSARAHYLEMALRLLIGTSLVVISPRCGQQTCFGSSGGPSSLARWHCSSCHGDGTSLGRSAPHAHSADESVRGRRIRVGCLLLYGVIFQVHAAHHGTTTADDVTRRPNYGLKLTAPTGTLLAQQNQAPSWLLILTRRMPSETEQPADRHVAPLHSLPDLSPDERLPPRRGQAEPAERPHLGAHSGRLALGEPWCSPSGARGMSSCSSAHSSRS